MRLSPERESNEWWLDIGSGMDAERFAGLALPHGVRCVAMDPLITSGRVGSGTLAALPSQVHRVGAEIRPAGSVERDRDLSFLPFRDRSFSRVHCGFVLHLFLELLPLLVAESHRVLRPGGEFNVLIPHFGEARSDAIVRDTHAAVRACFGEADLHRYAGPANTFWADLYQGKVWQITAHRACQD